THVAPEHAAVAFGSAGQGVLQAPQCSTSEESSLSQPLHRLMSQSAKPGSHAVIEQKPVTHPVAALGSVGQTLPHDPQLLGSPWRSISQPFAASMSQSAKPTTQPPDTHWPATQSGCSFISTWQGWLQSPQCAGSV